MTVHAFAAPSPGEPLVPFEYEAGEVRSGEVDIDVRWCGICHSDLSMIDDAWGLSEYPLVPGHEVIGTVAAAGDAVPHLRSGDTVGLGWVARSCYACAACRSGAPNLCPDVEGTIVGRHGGFATRVRAQGHWVLPLPPGLSPESAGPLFCAGITVFHPMVENALRPDHRVGVVGIGGLGHMALQFLSRWGCEVTAFSTTAEKEQEARRLGAHRFVLARDASALEPLAGTFDLILVTVNVDLPWDAYVAALRPRGRLHLVGAAPRVSAAVFPLIAGQKSIGASPVGSPANIERMLGFAARHGILPVTERFPLSKVNDAVEKLRWGKPPHRLVLENDLP